MGPRDATAPVRVGLISDTHDRLPASVAAVFRGVAHIVHAGDVCDDAVMTELECIAPVTAARGNCDDRGPCSDAPGIARVVVGGKVFVVCHERRELRRNPRAVAGADVVVTGHTHNASVETEGGAVWVDPGSASFPRDARRGTVGVATIGPDGAVGVAIIPL